MRNKRNCLKFRQYIIWQAMNKVPHFPKLPPNLSEEELLIEIRRRLAVFEKLDMARRQERSICGAINRAGLPCQKSPSSGRTRCRLHGGASLLGENHPNYQHGHCSKAWRQKSVELTARVRMLRVLAENLGMVNPRR